MAVLITISDSIQYFIPQRRHPDKIIRTIGLKLYKKFQERLNPQISSSI